MTAILKIKMKTEWGGKEEEKEGRKEHVERQQ